MRKPRLWLILVVALLGVATLLWPANLGAARSSAGADDGRLYGTPIDPFDAVRGGPWTWAFWLKLHTLSPPNAATLIGFWQIGGGALFQVYFDQASTSVTQVKAGRIRVLAVTAEERFAPLPDVPTFDEAGVKGFHVMNVTGLVGPAGMPQAVVQRLHEATVKALQDPKVQERMKGIGATIVGSTPQAFGAWIREDLARWKKVVTQAKVPQQ